MMPLQGWELVGLSVWWTVVAVLALIGVGTVFKWAWKCQIPFPVLAAMAVASIIMFVFAKAG